MTGKLLVIAPHPDDELLGAGAIMARTLAARDTVAVIVATDGSQSDPYADRRALVAQRRYECAQGLAAMLGATPAILFLDQPDGALSGPVLDIGCEAIVNFMNDAAPDTIIVTDPADGHPDHKAAFGFATRLVSGGWGRKLAVMPVSQRVDGRFDHARFTEIPVAPFGARKAGALACHASQIGSATGFSIPSQVLAEFCESEFLRTAYDRDDAAPDAIPPGHFETMFEASPDPWRYDDDPYERDRFRRTVDALADRHYSSALELGCANGALTEQIAPLCDRLLATDSSSWALSAAQNRVRHLPNVILRHAALPHDVPDGPFDLIVASDMLYYLGLEGVVASMAKLDRQASPDCRMLIASFLGETDTRLTGEMSSETAIAHLPGWRLVRSERTVRLRIDLLARQ